MGPSSIAGRISPLIQLLLKASAAAVCALAPSGSVTGAEYDFSTDTSSAVPVQLRDQGTSSLASFSWPPVVPRGDDDDPRLDLPLPRGIPPPPLARAPAPILACRACASIERRSHTTATAFLALVSSELRLSAVSLCSSRRVRARALVPDSVRATSADAIKATSRGVAPECDRLPFSSPSSSSLPSV